MVNCQLSSVNRAKLLLSVYCGHILCYCAETGSTLKDTYFTFVYFGLVELTGVQKSNMQTSENVHLHGLDS